MNPTLAKMMMDERIREITRRAERASAFGRPARQRSGAFARWISTFRTRPARAGGTSASTAECCPAI